MSFEQLEKCLESNKQTYIDQLVELLKIKSISSIEEHRNDVIKAAAFLAHELKSLELTVEIINVQNGHPLVYAETKIEPDRPTILFYGHFDVQPVDPLEKWNNPPFEPTIKNNNIYARGASDDKGQLYTHIKAFETYIKSEIEVPVNLKFLFEGEEECGGHSIYKYTEENPEKLACDVVVVSDSCVYDEETPAICYSLKGLVAFEVKVFGPKDDLHSGSFGGTVQNPVNAICEIIAGLKNINGKIMVPGFYDDVLELEDIEKSSFESLNYTDDILKEVTGSPSAFGESGYTTLERKWSRPTCDVNGIWGGYCGDGAKTIIPSEAGAKISMRLVPNQDPDKIMKSVKKHILDNTPFGVRVEVELIHSAKAVLVPLKSAMMQAGVNAMEKGFGKKPVFIREGGSIPIVGTFQECLKAPVLLLGYGLNSDNIHSPNEKFSIDHYIKGIKTTLHLISEVALAKDLFE